MPAVSKLLKPCSEPKSTICGRTLIKSFIFWFSQEKHKIIIYDFMLNTNRTGKSLKLCNIIRIPFPVLFDPGKIDPDPIEESQATIIYRGMQ